MLFLQHVLCVLSCSLFVMSCNVCQVYFNLNVLCEFCYVLYVFFVVCGMCSILFAVFCFFCILAGVLYLNLLAFCIVFSPVVS